MVRIKELQRRSLTGILTSFVIGSYSVIAAVMLAAAVFMGSLQRLLKHQNLPFVKLTGSSLQVPYYTLAICCYLLDLQMRPKTKVK